MLYLKEIRNRVLKSLGIGIGSVILGYLLLYYLPLVLFPAINLFGIVEKNGSTFVYYCCTILGIPFIIAVFCIIMFYMNEGIKRFVCWILTGHSTMGKYVTPNWNAIYNVLQKHKQDVIQIKEKNKNSKAKKGSLSINNECKAKEGSLTNAVHK